MTSRIAFQVIIVLLSCMKVSEKEQTSAKVEKLIDFDINKTDSKEKLLTSDNACSQTTNRFRSICDGLETTVGLIS